MRVIDQSLRSPNLNQILFKMKNSSREKVDFLAISFTSQFLEDGQIFLQKRINLENPLVGWMKAFDKRIKDLRTQGISGAIKPWGLDVSLLSFSFDLINLYISHSLPKELLVKIFNKDVFYSTRYEIVIASIFLNSEYCVQWVECDNHLKKIPEFQAIKEGEIFLVEAKSKGYRTSVDFEKPYLARLNIQQYLQEAITKNQEKKYPFLIFFDVNLPFTILDDDQKTKFMERVVNSIRGLKADHEGKHSFDYAYISNWSWHYHPGDITNSQKKITCPIRPQKSFNPIAQSSIDIIESTIRNYGSMEFRSRIMDALKQWEPHGSPC